MPSPDHSPSSSLRQKPLPRPKWFDAILLSSPVEPGIYGAKSQTVYLTTNHRPTLLREVTSHPGHAILAIDAGGFSPRFSEALGTPTHATRLIHNQLASTEDPGTEKHLYLALPLAKSLKWQNDEKKEGYSIHVTQATEQKQSGLVRSLANLALRLAASLYLWLGQALLFFIPLIIWGVPVLIAGLSCLLISTLFLALIWNIPISNPLLKGGIAAVILACAALGFYAALVSANPLEGVKFSVAIFVSTLWMTSVFLGLRFR